MATAEFFEGPEKKVELVVTSDFPSLRSFGDDRWRAAVKKAGASVISKLENESCVAYLLSESSLFVYDDYLVMITCGRTSLVNAVAEILSFVPAESVALLVYERKNEHFPQLQPTSFFDDAKRLSAMIPGRAVRFGGEHGRCVQIFHTSRPYTPERDDPTLEILMHGIDPEVTGRFTARRLSPEDNVVRDVGLDRMFVGFDISDYVFEPAGYSLNALKGDVYYTIHVTPEPLGSYVSFETNYDFRTDLSGMVGGIVELFRPKSFDVVTFLPEGVAQLNVPGYRLADRIEDELGGYQVSYIQYFRPFKGPRRAHDLALS